MSLPIQICDDGVGKNRIQFKIYQAKWERVAVLSVLLVIIFIGTLMFKWISCCKFHSDEYAKIKILFQKVSSKLESLKQRHKNLTAKSKKISGLKSVKLVLVDTVGLVDKYENLRRRIYCNIKELWFFVKHTLKDETDKNLTRIKIKFMLEEIASRKRSLLSDQEQLPRLDGHEEWRHKEARSVSDLVQRRLHYLQHPTECHRAKKLVCNLNKNYCGFGCQIHHVVYCLIFAYATERTLVLNSEEWKYFKNGWNQVFLPLSETCTSVYDGKVVPWPASKDAKIISIPFLEELSELPQFLPLAIPEDLAHRIVKFNGDPPSWWIGQMLKFILKLQVTLQDIINATIISTTFKSQVVGVHVRRTDKVGTEAVFHDISEYMSQVDEYYAQLELTSRDVVERRVYLATDDADVIEEAHERYPQYTFYGNPRIARTAAAHQRYSSLSLNGLLLDLHMLAKCNFLVATFTSQFGRVAYEMMQANRADASQSYHSLDDIYHFVGQISHDRIIVVPTVTLNNSSCKAMRIPLYKTVDQLVVYPFPEYKQVPLSTL